ncbi:hypothetical protein [Arcticibacter tournemirensis]|uniref:Uncharacterized protein n=1 Tax=Arcticibacter tournemirensis TaxID=699437 RepID=A0A4Q0M3L7_9SPHI|nr:hypothetical protein [Arcticibacter tournemirensis]RXF67518.1 hypothetical protein EKH83_19430 [Arcticibacter tournemirensis]
MENTTKDYTHIKGWGIDADPENEPTYPMKKYTGDDHNRLNWIRPVQQPASVEILHSNERPNLSAVFGTPVPPSGISGAIRRYAFKYSEGSYGHWLPLILADKINVIEGLIDDVKQGHIPNFFAEKGLKSEWKYNRKAFVQKVFIGALITTAVVAIVLKKKK